MNHQSDVAQYAPAGLTETEVNRLIERHGGLVNTLKFINSGDHNQTLKLIRRGAMISNPDRPWWTQDEEICLRVTSDGTTGTQWHPRLTEKGISITPTAENLLYLDSFRPTQGTTTEIVVLSMALLQHNVRNINDVISEAEKRHLVVPSLEHACLIRELLTDKEVEAMGLARIIVMHEPMSDGEEDNLRLDINRTFGGNTLGTFYGSILRPDLDDGFAFVRWELKTGELDL